MAPRENSPRVSQTDNQHITSCCLPICSSYGRRVTVSLKTNRSAPVREPRSLSIAALATSMSQELLYLQPCASQTFCNSRPRNESTVEYGNGILTAIPDIRVSEGDVNQTAIFLEIMPATVTVSISRTPTCLTTAATGSCSLVQRIAEVLPSVAMMSAALPLVKLSVLSEIPALELTTLLLN